MNDLFIPEIRVGEPVLCGALAVYPLFAERRTLFADSTLDYLLSDQAMAAGTCTVVETGMVSKVVVNNSGDKPVLFLEGEELEQGHQSRVLRASVLVGAATQTTVPVYCVERKRWGGSSPHLTTGSHSPPSLRHLLKGGSSGMGISRGFDRQAAVWRLIAAKHRATATISEHESMSDVLRSHPEMVKELRHTLKYPEGALGIAVTRSGKTGGIDLFDSPQTLEKLWDRLVVLGLTLDALEARDTGCQASTSDIAVRLYRTRNMRWRRVESVVGMGEVFNARGDDGTLATALLLEGSLIHLSISAPI